MPATIVLHLLGPSSVISSSGGAQDLMSHIMREKSIDICFIAEPASTPNSNSWIRSMNGLAAFV